MDEFIAKRLRVYGKVQGVGFRFYTVREALRLNLTGWVRNRLDGSVEIQAQGRTAAIDDFLHWARIGPDSARVDRVEAIEAQVEDQSTFNEVDTL
ncbi:acylphosphatase [Jeongeupia sp. HS-3]|uniref:acylphosphatase n=1 Tax=Jeongeupia sp. HS-3 TaxID=1009682 RepID=UPI0018A37FDB|nr:acylphosphatase [Jeongeupia sp. HS-3]BCL74954.1 acylphosphatase [Jeongeupia sp. HS-3]